MSSEPSPVIQMQRAAQQRKEAARVQAVADAKRACRVKITPQVQAAVAASFDNAKDDEAPRATLGRLSGQTVVLLCLARSCQQQPER